MPMHSPVDSLTTMDSCNWPLTPHSLPNGTQFNQDTHGPPDEAMPSRLIWFDNGSWKRTVMHRDGTPHTFPMEHTDYFKQVIHYGVPPDTYDDLGHFDGSVCVDRTNGELAATCRFEAANLQALNLAHDITAGEKQIEAFGSFRITGTLARTDTNAIIKHMS